MKSKLFILTKEGEFHQVDQIKVQFDDHFQASKPGAKINTQMSVDEVAEYLKLKRSGIYGLVHKRKIPHAKRGKRLYFDKHSIDEWIKNGKVDTDDDLHKKASEYLLKNKL